MNREIAEKVIVAIVQSICESDEDEHTVDSPPFVQIVTDEAEVVPILFPILNICMKNGQTRIRNFVEEVVLSYNEREFIMHFRLRRTMVNTLVEKFQSSDEYQKLNGHGGFSPLSAEKYILTFLWFVGHEAASYRDVADRFGITLAGLYNTITRVADFILTMKLDVIRLPNNIEKEKTKQYYLEQKRVPGVIGSIDGTHIRIDKPIQDKDSYINRKQYFSIQMQGIANEERKFIDVWIGYPGSVHDARVFRESTICNMLPQLCSDGSYILGDSAYPCLPYLMVPYRDNGHLSRAQRSFNQRLSSCRISIEHAFGCLKQRFRQLYHFKLRNLKRMVKIIHACCILHNLADLDDLAILEPPNQDKDVDNEEVISNRSHNEEESDDIQGLDIRDELCRQFASQI